MKTNSYPKYYYKYEYGSSNLFLSLTEIKELIKHNFEIGYTYVLCHNRNGEYYIKRFNSDTDQEYHLYYNPITLQIYKIKKIKSLY